MAQPWTRLRPKRRHGSKVPAAVSQIGTPQPFADLVRSAARAALEEAVPDEALRSLTTRALAKPPYVLSRQQLRAAPLVLGAYEAAGGNGDAGGRAAAAMEFLTAALHLFDGLADGDTESSSTDIQVGLALHYSTAFVLDRIRMIDGSRADWAPIYRLMNVVCAGQQRDLDLQLQPKPTLDEAKTMTFQKTGAFGEALTLAGALAAGAQPDLCRNLALLGQYLGARGQLIDDATDASPEAVDTSDIRLRKKTLPIAFFIGQAGKDSYDNLRVHLSDSRPIAPEVEEALRRAIQDSGGLEMTLVYASWLRIKATQLLEEMQVNGCRTELLRAHLASTEDLPV